MNIDQFTHPFFSRATLMERGLNLHGLIDLDAVPKDVYDALYSACDDLPSYCRVVLIGHGGRAMWDAVSDSFCFKVSQDPIDTFTVSALQQFFSEFAPAMRYQIVYPGSAYVPLQKIGSMLGWHNDSPFKLGLNAEWGSWFAYRALVLVNAKLPLTKPLRLSSPCDECETRPCQEACPPKAVSEHKFELQRCLIFRKEDNSLCHHKCLSRLACPIGSDHQYSDAQMRYHYLQSLRVIKAGD